MDAGPTNDTHPEFEALLVEGYRKMSPTQKLERVRALTRAEQELARAVSSGHLPMDRARPDGTCLWLGPSQDGVLMLSKPILVVANQPAAYFYP